MERFLLFQLYGPLSSWGEIAVGEERRSASHPGKSAIMGLIAASLGVKRDDEEKHLALDQNYGLAVVVDSQGTYLKDFHTTQMPPAVAFKNHPGITRRDELLALDRYQQQVNKTSGTILSNREYRCDAAYRVALWLREENKQVRGSFPCLIEIQKKLCFPKFSLYLGRKSCPLALPLQPQIIEAESLIEAFAKAKFAKVQDILSLKSSADHDLFSENPLSMYFDKIACSGVPARESYVRRDSVKSRSRWHFSERIEHHSIITPKDE